MNAKMLGAALLAGAVVAGCDEPTSEKEDEKVLAVNGEVLMRSAVDADVEAIMKSRGAKIPEDQKAYVRQMANGHEKPNANSIKNSRTSPMPRHCGHLSHPTTPDRRHWSRRPRRPQTTQ